MQPLERAQAQLALAQATAALFQLLLRANGVDPSDHESRKEQVRMTHGRGSLPDMLGQPAAVLAAC